jgi:eukaryotic-like serine/threonine-protein kinase
VFPFKLPDRYTFVGPKLKGGQGEVYVCTDKFLDRKVAIKVMTNLAEPAEIRHELTAIQAIRSRHIAQLFDVVESTNGAVGLVEEFVPGTDVGSWAFHNTGGDAAEDCLVVLYQIACGLSDIHASGKIHRDIKPRNIKFDSERIIKILDFGLASEAAPDLETVDARGTPCYLAPELYGEPPVKFTSAVDTFAFGVTARVIAQQGALLPVFRQTPPYATPLPGFESAKLTLPPDVVAILNRTLDTNPKRRPEMSNVRDAIGKRLLFGKHRAVITYGANHQLSDPGKSIILKVGTDGVTILYDGMDFRVAAQSGDAYINNIPAQTGSCLPASCVITLGGAQLGSGRTYVPFNVSHPGVVL